MKNHWRPEMVYKNISTYKLVDNDHPFLPSWARSYVCTSSPYLCTLVRPCDIYSFLRLFVAAIPRREMKIVLTSVIVEIVVCCHFKNIALSLQKNQHRKDEFCNTPSPRPLIANTRNAKFNIRTSSSFAFTRNRSWPLELSWQPGLGQTNLAPRT